ncbi:YicC family protein [Vannielia litorea]|uniref:YicC/YloC family endoribonuclease n=1 Tax=Vannielia litorea TaxID=1217970 RepID=UPI001C938A2B|nr:YicC/YloC family endoribonuclease [Vannielia litorea]MBY6047186.1 YicC family protein [Vannielia litorea]MBY6074600.1 YicC family protein [Vannielia litorea]MBY6152881.1 YicC family protein [Vannielia litorea]
MTGFATRSQQGSDFSWSWELRGVNGKGLDLRLRLPEWIGGLEQALRTELNKALVRGNVSLSLRLQRSRSDGQMRLDSTQLSQVLSALSAITREAERAGVELKAPTTAEILSMKGIADDPNSLSDGELVALRSKLVADFRPLLDSFIEMRATEGAALHAVMLAHLDKVAKLVREARPVAEERKAEMAASLKENLARVLENAKGLDQDRVAQEVALLALKSDVTEELDRLEAHVTASRDLLASEDAVGRKLDFLCQEFNREANTLCSKAQAVELTRIGLDLKAAIDQMREQVQNIE